MTSSSSTTQPAQAPPRFSFNLWTEPWIVVQADNGKIERLGLRDSLLRADRILSLADASPLVVASVQRLLAAIAQDMLKPQSLDEVAKLIKRESFDAEAIERFGTDFGHRFDIFSETEPFLQTSDVPIDLPAKKSKSKTVAYLFPEDPAGTNINHFSHSYEDEYQCAPATVAQGLVTIPAFATSGGAGIKPSINGVPPLYELPTGDTLFQTIALSIILPEFRSLIAATDDRPAWRGPTVVGKQETVMRVGYLESLTFAARRVRLFPERVPGGCSHTGEQSEVVVRRMLFEMGRSRPKEAAPWFDPFAAYHIREKNVPAPIRPREDKAIWREYATLFHTMDLTVASAVEGDYIRPPGVVLQLAELEEYGVKPNGLWRFRCIGMRTDKAKVFEWVDDSLDVPAELLASQDRQIEVGDAIARAEEWIRHIARIHYAIYARGRGDLDDVRQRMRAGYWRELADPFRSFVLRAVDPATHLQAVHEWIEQLFAVGEQVLLEAADAAGERGDALFHRAEALTSYRIARAKSRKEWLG